MTEITMTELRKMAKEHTNKLRKCSDTLTKAVSAISARKDCNDVIQCDPSEGDLVSFTFDGEVPSVSDVLRIEFDFIVSSEPARIIVHYTCEKHHYFDETTLVKLDKYIANLNDEDNKLILQYDAVEEKILLIEDRSLDISVEIDDNTADDMAEIIYSNATKLI